MIKAVFIYPANGYTHHQEHCKTTGLIEGNEYNLVTADVGSWHTDVYLEGFEKPFNSVHFRFYLNDKEVDIIPIYRGNYYD